MSTDALELALALHQAPIQRFALRDRPLPANMDEVLQLASAMQPQLQAAAARFSESEETIVEAVRFYLQQVLFEPGTDAYRILGIAADADFQQIRQHHVWLQRWLHPDRRGEDWEAALSTKVNWAWQQLRDVSSREEYDQSRRQQMLQKSAHPDMQPMQVPAWSAAPVMPSRHWLRRGLMGSFFAVCIVLLYLAATRQDRVDPDALASHSSAADSGIRPRMPFTDESTHPATVPAGNSAPLASQRNSPDYVSTQDPAVALGEHSASSPDASARSPESLPPPTASSASTQGAEAQRARPSIDRRGISAAAPLQEGQSAAVAASVDSSDRDRADTSPRVVAVQATVPASAPGGIARTQRGAAATAGNDRIALAAPPRPRQPPTAEANLQATVEAKVEPGPPVLASAIRPVSAIETLPARSDDAIAAMPASAAAQLGQTMPPPMPPAELDRATLRRFELARARVTSMVSYFRSPDADPPQWQDESSRNAVAREREILRQRSGGEGSNRFVLDPPVWQISHSTVSLKSNYRLGSRHRPVESGRLLLDMVWLEDRWTIIHIELSPRS